MKTRKSIKNQVPKISAKDKKLATEIEACGRAGTKVRKAIITLLTIVVTPFYFFYGIFFKIPANYSPLLGIFRFIVTFSTICWLTTDAGHSFEREMALYLSSFMDISLAKLVVSALELPIGISFFVSILIMGGFHMSMELTAEDKTRSTEGTGPYPNIDHGFKDLDRRLGYGTGHGMISFFKMIMK